MSSMKNMCGSMRFQRLDQQPVYRSGWVGGNLSIPAKYVDPQYKAKKREIKVFVKTLAGKTIFMDVESTITIRALKQKITERENLPINQQRLMFAGRELENDRRLMDYDVKDKGLITMANPFDDGPMKVYIKSAKGKTTTVDVEPTETVRSLKIKIQGLEKIPPGQQRLMFAGTVLNDQKTIRDYRIPKNGVISLGDGEESVEGRRRKSSISRAFGGAKKMALNAIRPKERGRALTGLGHVSNESGMPLNVRMPDGTSITLDVDPTDPILWVKEQIEGFMGVDGIPAAEQRLVYAGKPVEDTRTLADYQIPPDSTIHLNPTSMPINVKTPKGKTVTLQVESSDTVDNVKKLLGFWEGSGGTPYWMQRLKKKGGKAGDSMPDNQTLSDLGVGSGNTIDLVAGHPLYIKTPKGKLINLDASPEDTVGSLKSRLAFWEGIPEAQQRLMFHGQAMDDNRPLKHYNIPKGGVVHLNPDKMGMYIRKPDGNTMLVEVDPSDTVSTFKQKLSQISGVGADQQNLLFAGTNLDNGTTIGEYDIPEDSVVYMNPEAVTVTVHLPTGKTASVDVLPSDTVYTFKNKLHKLEGIPTDMQRLEMPGEPTMGSLNNAKTVGEYPIIAGTELNMSEANPLYILKPDGKTVVVDFDPTVEDVATLKQKIAELTGMPVEQQRLVHQGKPLVDNRAKVSAYKVPKNGTVELNPNSVPIQVHTPDGKTITLQVNPLDTVNKVKDLMSYWEGIPPEEQRINLTGKKWKRPLWDNGAGLGDDRTLRSVGVGKNGDLDLSNSDPLKVVLPNGKAIYLDAKPSNTIADLKHKLVPFVGMTPKEQNLLGVDGKPLMDPKTLAESQIPIGGTVYLNPVQGDLKVQDDNGVAHSVPINAYDTVGALKNRLKPLMGLSEDPKLFHNGIEFGALPLHDTLPISDFEVNPATSTVYANPTIPAKMTVRLPGGKTVTVDASPADTVSMFKNKLAKLAAIPIEEQNVLANGTPLYNNEMTLGEYGVPANGDMELTDPFGVNVRLPNGKTVRLQTDPKAPLGELKERLASLSGIPSSLQDLFSEGVEGPLADAKSLEAYGIPKGSTLELNPGAYPISVQLPNGKSVPMYVMPSDTFDGIKTKLQNLEGLPKSKKPLIHSGKEQPDSMTMDDANVQPNDTVYIDPKEFALDVRDPTGKMFKIQVTPADNLMSLRKKIGKVKGIAPEETRMMYDSTPLGDDPRCTLDDYGIVPGATMDMAKSNPISVRTPEGQVHVLDCDPEETVGSLKKRIQNFDGRIPENPDEELRMLYNGAPLDDLHPISNYNIPKNGVVDMVSGMSVFVRTPQGKVLSLDVDPFDTIGDVKQKIQYLEAIPVEYQRLVYLQEPLSDNTKTLKGCKIKPNSTLELQDANPIYVTTPSGRVLTIDLDPSTTIADLKKKLSEIEGIPSGQQKIFFAGKPLSNTRSLQDYRVPKGATLDMNPEKHDITIKTPDGKLVALNVDPNAPISAIKDHMQFWEGILPEDQRLLYGGEPLPDNKSLNDLNVPPMATINLEQAHPLFAKLPDGSTVPLDVEPTDTLSDIKKKIELMTGTPSDNQRVVFEGHELVDDKTLQDYNIPAGGTLVIDDPTNPTLVTVSAKTPSGNEVTVEIDPEDSIASIKSKMQHWQDVPEDRRGQQRLAYQGVPLEDGMTLGDYDIPPDGMLDLDEPFQIYVQFPEEDPKMLTLDVEPDEKVTDVKSMIEAMEGLPSKDQRLVFENMPLANNRTLEDYRVPRGAVLFLNPDGFDGQQAGYYIFVLLLTGKTVMLNKIDPTDSILTVKATTKTLEKIPQQQEMSLRFKGRALDDDQTLLDLEVPSGATLLEVLERGLPEAINQVEASDPNDRYEAAFAQASKAADAEKNGDIDYAAALYQNAGETLLRAAEVEKDPSLRAPVKAKGDDLLDRANLLRTTGESATAQPRRMTIVQAQDPEAGNDGERISMVTPRSKSIGAGGEMMPYDDDMLEDEMAGENGNRKVPLDDLSVEAGLRYTPVNTSPRRFDDDGYSLRANGLPDGVWGKLAPREVRAFAAVTCYNEHGEELRRSLTAFARNVFMLQQVFGDRVWEEMPISVIIDGRAMASQSMLDFCHKELGVFSPEVMAISSLGLEVQMHLFERTVFMPQVDKIPLPPIHVIFALKENNSGKLDSHAWFFEAFAEHLKPKYCILIDVGTVPTETAIFRLMRSMDRNPYIAGVCGELTTYRPNFCHITVAAQHFEYKISNILDRSTGAVFGFIDVLPGAFSAYRYAAVKTKEHPLTGEPEGPLVHYFQTLTTPMDQLGPFLGNMHLAEDRILCFEIVARLNEKWTMHYCKGAVAKTDVPETIEGLIRQRRRWLNGTFFAAVYTVMRFPRVVNDTVHSWVRKFFLFWDFVFIALVLLVTWLFISNLYLTFFYIWKGGFRNLADDNEQGAEDALLFMSLVYISVLMLQFVVGLGNRPEDVSLVYRLSVFYFGTMMIFTLILSLIPLFSLEIWLVRDDNYCEIAKRDVENNLPDAEKCALCEEERGSVAVSVVLAFGFYFFGGLLHGELAHVAVALVQYFVMIPTFINILAVYAYSNIHDLSWGTKGLEGGDDAKSVKTKKGRGSIANFIEREKAQKEADKRLKRQQYKIEAQFKNFRTFVLAFWILSNFWYANIILYIDPFGYCFLSYISFFIIGFNGFRVCGSMVFIGIRTCRGAGERMNLITRPYALDASSTGRRDRPVTPKKEKTGLLGMAQKPDEPLLDRHDSSYQNPMPEARKSMNAAQINSQKGGGAPGHTRNGSDIEMTRPSIDSSGNPNANK